MKFKKDQKQQYLHNELNRHVPGVMRSHRNFCRLSSFLMRKVNKSSAVLSKISESLSCGITRVRDQFLTLQEAITNIQSDLCIKQGKEWLNSLRSFRKTGSLTLKIFK